VAEDLGDLIAALYRDKPNHIDLDNGLKLFLEIENKDDASFNGDIHKIEKALPAPEPTVITSPPLPSITSLSS
jgi:hypothetical protein